MLGQAEGRSARTHRHQMSSGGPRERAPRERGLRRDRSVESTWSMREGVTAGGAGRRWRDRSPQKRSWWDALAGQPPLSVKNSQCQILMVDFFMF